MSCSSGRSLIRTRTPLPVMRRFSAMPMPPARAGARHGSTVERRLNAEVRFPRLQTPAACRSPRARSTIRPLQEWNHGVTRVASERPILRNLQLRLRLPVLAGRMAVKPTKGSCTFAMAIQIERGSYGTRLARRPRVHRPRLHAGGDGKGQLVGRARRRRPSERGAARRYHRDRQRRGRRSDGGVVGSDRKVPRRGDRADSLRAQRHEVVGQGRRSRRHGG